MAFKRRNATGNTAVAFFAATLVGVLPVGKIDARCVRILVMHRVETNYVRVVVDNFVVLRNDPHIRIQCMVVHTSDIFVMHGGCTRIVYAAGYVTHTTHTGVTIVIICQADMIGG